MEIKDRNDLLLEKKLQLVLQDLLKDTILVEQIVVAIKERYIDQKSHVTLKIPWETLRKINIDWGQLTVYIKKICLKLFNSENITVDKRARHHFILIFN